MKYIIPAILCAFLVATFTFAQGTGTINQLDQWRRTAAGQITQNIASSTIRLTGYESSGSCLVTNASGVVSLASCGTGGGGTSTGAVYLASSSPWITNQLTYVTGAGTIAGTSSPVVDSITATDNSGVNSFAGTTNFSTTTHTARMSLGSTTFSSLVAGLADRTQFSVAYPGSSAPNAFVVGTVVPGTSNRTLFLAPIVNGWAFETAFTSTGGVGAGHIVFQATSSAGFTGIGSSTPGSKLVVTNLLSSPSFIVEDQAADPSPFVIDAAGGVGIGTTALGTNKLTVEGTVRTVAVNTGGNVTITSSTTNAAVPFTVTSGDTASTRTIASFLGNYGSTTALALMANGNVGMGTSAPAYRLETTGDIAVHPTAGNATLRLLNSGTEYGSLFNLNGGSDIFLRATDAAGGINFRTGGNNTRMTITASGSVGIGSTTPSYALATEGTSGQTGQLNLLGINANIALGSNFLSGDGGDEGVFVNGSGNVGIGTTSPSTLFTVAGDMRLTGRFADSASSTGSVGSVLTATANGTAWVATSSLGIVGGSSGSSSPGGTSGQVQFNGGGVFAGSNTLFYNNVTNLFGVGTTTPSARLTVVATTTGSTANFFSNTGTTTLSISEATSTVRHASPLAGFVQASLARITMGVDAVLGYYRSGRLFGTLTIEGLFFQEDWNQVDCSSLVGATQIAADGLTGCDGFAFYEDNTATLTSTAGQGNVYGRLSTSAVTDGAGVFLNAPTSGFLIFATSTPVFEAVARLHSVQNWGTTTQAFIGYSNIAAAGTTYETAPTAGCFFTASTTIANWWAICRTSLVATTNVDTGIASTTVITGDGVPYRFMIEADTTGARFFLQNSEAGNLNQVANITTNVPSTTIMNAGVHFGRTTGVTAVGVDIYDMNMGWRKMLSRF